MKSSITYTFISFMLVFILSIATKQAVCQDYEGDYCKTELVSRAPSPSNSGLETVCISFSKYDGDQITVCWKNKVSKIMSGVELVFDQVSPGVFESWAGSGWVKGQPKPGFFKGLRIKFVTANKVVYSNYESADGSLVEKIIYTR